MHLTVSTLSGATATLEVPCTCYLTELRAKIENVLEIPSEKQRLLLDEREVPMDTSKPTTVQEAGLYDRAQLDVVCCSWVMPMPYPKLFHLNLSTSRRRLLPAHGGFSSAFIIMYDIKVDVPRSRAHVQQWRKNDNDRLEFDTIAGTYTGAHGHWMGGDSDISGSIAVARPMEELLQCGLGRLKPVLDEADRFWQLPATDATEAPDTPQAPASKSAPGRPIQHPDMPGWFVAPSAECTEFQIDADLPFMMLSRVLIDIEGKPIRVALAGPPRPNSDPIEEYDVRITTSHDDDTSKDSD